MKRTYVIAATHRQAEYYAMQQRLSRERFRYVSDPDILRSLKPNDDTEIIICSRPAGRYVWNEQLDKVLDTYKKLGGIVRII